MGKCIICREPIGDAWVEIIVQDTMGEDLVQRVAFVDTYECLTAYAEKVAKNKV